MKTLPTMAPRQLPPFSLLIDDIPGGSNITLVAKHLGQDVESVRLWQQNDNAPRSALLALFWESRWGKSVLDANIHNSSSIAFRTVKSLQRENNNLRTRIARLENTNTFGAANSSQWHSFDRIKTNSLVSPLTSDRKLVI